MKHILFLCAAVALLSGCEPDQPKQAMDQCKRAELFQQCISTLPAGPKTTMYNDWAEVVSECRAQARDSSYRAWKEVAPECRSY